MYLLEMMIDSEHCDGLSIHMGTGWGYINKDHLSIIVRHYMDTGENLLDSYRDTIAWNDDSFVSYKLSDHTLSEDERSKTASRISKIRKLNIFEPEYVLSAINNCSKISGEINNRIKTKKEKKRSIADKYISRNSVREKVFELHGESCLNCGSDTQICLDHIVPISRGGANKIDNLQPLCFSCNASKGTQIIDYR